MFLKSDLLSSFTTLGKQAATQLVESLQRLGVNALNILVNNSGATWGEPFEKHSEKGWDRVMDLNVKGLFYVTQACFPLLKTATSADYPSRVINIGSIAGLRTQLIPTYAYDISKAAVHHLTGKFAAAFSGENILCNAIAPGVIPSKMSEGIFTYSSKSDVESNVPLGRLGNEEDIMAVTLYLCGKGGNWVTGAVIPVDGGSVHGRAML